MRHGDKIKNLSRTKAHRKALLSNLACQLIEHKRINTTLTKAKSLRVFVEPIITKSKVDSTHNRRLVFNKLQNKKAVTELFSTINDKVADRPGGYTRIIKLPPRFGDAADMAMIELVDFNTIYVKGETTTKKTRRSRRGAGKAKTSSETGDVQNATEVVEAESEKVYAQESAAIAKDDLKKIEGIGPKAAEVLNNAGIHTFLELAGKKAEEIKSILEQSGGHFHLQDTTTWAQQAELAAAGKWDELKKLQDELKGGKKEEA